MDTANELPPGLSQGNNSREEKLVTPTGTLHGTLQLPCGSKPVPVVLIISGSGGTDRDGNARSSRIPNQTLKLLATELAARGIGSLRYDKRGVGASEAALSRESALTFDTYIQDAVAWAEHLVKDCQFQSLAIMGHSEGALIATVVARRVPADCLISLAGSAHRGGDLLRQQLLERLPDHLVADATSIIADLQRAVKPPMIPLALMPLFRPSVQPYLTSWFAYSPTEELSRLDIPILLIQGTADRQISAEDIRTLQAANVKARALSLAGVDHQLRRQLPLPVGPSCDSGNPWPPIAVEVPIAVAQFVSECTNGRQAPIR